MKNKHALYYKIKFLSDNLNQGLIERDVAIRLSLLALLTKEHILLLGSPGTAKSEIAKRLHLSVSDKNYFERLLTRFTVPEEVFGPLSIKSLEDDRYERLTDSYMPKSSIVFLDEIFKANSAILNSLLTLLNERKFDNGTKREHTPLMSVVGASNELPEGEELEALYDRFLIRLHVAPVSDNGFPDLLSLRGASAPAIPQDKQLTIEEIELIVEDSEKIIIPNDTLNLFCELRKWCIAEGIAVSDRRWRKAIKLLQVSALTNGRDYISFWDCWLLQHCIWEKVESKSKIYEWYKSKIGIDNEFNFVRITRIVIAWENKIKDIDITKNYIIKSKDNIINNILYLSPYSAEDINGRKIVDRTNNGNGYTLKELDELFFYDDHSARFPYNLTKEKIQFKNSSIRDNYINNTTNWFTPRKPKKSIQIDNKNIGNQGALNYPPNEINEIHAKILSYKESLCNHIKSFNSEINDHLWITNDFIETTRDTLSKNIEKLEDLINRIQRIQDINLNTRYPIDNND